MHTKLDIFLNYRIYQKKKEEIYFFFVFRNHYGLHSDLGQILLKINLIY